MIMTENQYYEKRLKRDKTFHIYFLYPLLVLMTAGSFTFAKIQNDKSIRTEKNVEKIGEKQKDHEKTVDEYFQLLIVKQEKDEGRLEKHKDQYREDLQRIDKRLDKLSEDMYKNLKITKRGGEIKTIKN